MATRARQGTGARADQRDPHARLSGDGLTADARSGPAQAGRQRAGETFGSEAEIPAQRLVRRPDRTADAHAPTPAAETAPPLPPPRHPPEQDETSTLPWWMSPIACKGLVPQILGPGDHRTERHKDGLGLVGNPQRSAAPAAKYLLPVEILTPFYPVAHSQLSAA